MDTDNINESSVTETIRSQYLKSFCFDIRITDDTNLLFVFLLVLSNFCNVK